MKNYSSWNQQQFHEYLLKSNQYELNNNFKNINGLIANKNPPFNIYQSKSSINKQQEIDNFYSLPGIPLSDEVPMDYAALDNEEEYMANGLDEFIKSTHKQNENLQLDNSKDHDFKYGRNEDLDPVTAKFNLLNNINKIQPTFKTSQTFNSTKSSFGTLQKAYTQAANNLKAYINSVDSKKSNVLSSFLRDVIGNVTQSDKSVQTISTDNKKENIFKHTSEKSNQTVITSRRSHGVTTDPSLMNKWIDNYLNSMSKSLPKSPNEVNGNSAFRNPAIQLKTQTIEADLSLHTPSPIILPVKYESSKYCATVKINTQDIPKERLNTYKKIIQQNSDSENESLNGNESNPDEFTVISKGNSKFTSFTDILQNLGLHLKNNVTKSKPNTQNKLNISQDKENCFTSFWDNPLDKFELQKSEPHQMNEKGLYFEVSDTTNDQANQSLKENVLSTKQTNIEKGDSHASLLETEKDKACLKLRNAFVERIKSKSFVNESKVASKSFGYTFSCGRNSDTTTNGLKFNKTFYLNPYDDLVKSHFNPMDRRIKSVSSKNGSSIVIEGPINSLDNYSANMQTKKRAIYRCIIGSTSQENLEKCINYLKETFPNTYLRNGMKNVLK